MKTLIFSIIAFILCIAAVVINCIYITSTADQLLKSLSQSEEEATKVSESLETFESIWTSCRLIMSISVNRMEIEEIDRLLARAKTQLEISDMVGFDTTLEELKEAIKDIVETETFSWEGIL